MKKLFTNPISKWLFQRLLHPDFAMRLGNYLSVKNKLISGDDDAKFLGEDPRLGPEMRSTGEVMGIGVHLGQAFAKAQLGSGHDLPNGGQVFISIRDQDKDSIAAIAWDLLDLGFTIVATRGTAATLHKAGIACSVVNKVSEGRPHVVDQIKNGDIHFIINISKGKMAASNSALIRQSAITHKICYTTTLSGAKAACLAMRYAGVGQIYNLQSLHQPCDSGEKV